MLRWACVLSSRAGVEIHATVHDALFVGGPSDAIRDVVEETRRYMQRASEMVLGGFTIRTEPVDTLLAEDPPQVVTSPRCYMTEKGRPMWNTVLSVLEAVESEGDAAEAQTLFDSAESTEEEDG